MIYRECPYPLCFYLASGDTGSLVWGGGGRFLFGYYVFIFCLLLMCFRCFGFSSYSIVSCSHMGYALFLVLHAVVGSF